MNLHAPSPRRRIDATLQPGQTGFTLVELMIVVVIIGILAAIALPNYREYILKSKLSEASSVLSTRQLRMEQFYQDNRTYAGAACTAGGDCGICPTTDTKYFTLSCATAGSGQNFTYTATGRDDTANFIYRVTDAGAKSTVLPSGTTVNCWATNKAGGC